MSTLKTVGIPAAILATGFVGYCIYKSMQDKDEQTSESDDMTDFAEEAVDDSEDDVVYG